MQDEREVATEEGKAFANFHGIKFIETSAKSRYNVSEAFRMIAEDIYDQFENGVFKMEDSWDGIKVGAFNQHFLNGDLANNNRRFSDTGDERRCC